VQANKKKRILDDVAIAITLIASMLVLQWWQPTWVNRLEGIAYDFKLVHFSAPRPAPPVNIQILDIDETSLKAIGRWPWPRRYLAQLVQRLKRHGAIVIAFDMLFSEPQRNPVEQVEAELVKHGVNADLSLVRSALDDDGQFAQQVADNDVVLGTLLLHDPSLKKGNMPAPSIEQSMASKIQGMHDFSGYNASIASLNSAAQGQGFINAMFDDDGFLRRAALLSRFNGKLYSSLALETYRVYSFVEQIVPQVHQQSGYVSIYGIKIGQQELATDDRGQILIPYRLSKNRYQYTAASDLLNNRILDQRFDQAVVFVGSSSVGMSDLRATPISLVLPGVEIHASVFDALTQPEIQPVQPDWWLALNIAWLLVLGMLLGWILPRLSPLMMTIVACISIGLLILINVMLWRMYFIHLPFIVILMLSVSLFFVSITKGFYRENIKRQQVKSMFDQYVPPAHIDQILENPQQTGIRGERKYLTVLFADIRNFTQISEQLSAHELTQLLNDFFSPITEVIFNNNGTVDKYVGDMVMAFWGAPLKDESHEHNALSAALQMMTVAQSLSTQFSKKGWPEINIGIGINTGEMNVGDMGSRFRRSYTVIGDSVNLASRLESLTKYYGIDILVGDKTKTSNGKFHFQTIDKVKVKGKDIPVTIYRPWPKGISNKQLEEINKFNQFFTCYQTADFENAQQLLAKLIQEQGGSPLLTIYQKRLAFFIKQPPGRHWDGSYSLESK